MVNDSHVCDFLALLSYIYYFRPRVTQVKRNSGESDYRILGVLDQTTVYTWVLNQTTVYFGSQSDYCILEVLNQTAIFL